MKVARTELPPRQVSLAIEVEQERLERAMEEALRRLAGRVNVPGFRPGKAPRSMVERIVGRSAIQEEALEQLVPDVVNEAIEQEQVEPYTRPRVESIELDPLRVKAVVGLAPKVELGDYKGMRIDNEEPAVGEKEVDSVLQRLRQSYAQLVPVEREVRIGDQVGMDLRGVVAGEDTPFVDSKDAPFNVDPAAGTEPAPGFIQSILEMKSGDERTFTLALPDDYVDPARAGKQVEFAATVHSVKERQLPEPDDEFAQQVGEYADMSALRAAIEKQLRDSEEQRVRDKMQEDALGKLVEISSIEFPPQLVDHQAQHMLESFSRNIEQQGLQLAQYLRLVGKEQAAFEDEVRAEAETRIRRSLALDAFADAEQIAATDGEDTSRERKALDRLIEIAAQKTTDATQTSDTEGQAAEERGTA